MEHGEYRDAYFAGLIDGEGCFYIDGNRSSPSLEVKMTCFKTVDALKQHFGGTVRLRKSQKAHWQDQWCWRARGLQFQAVLPRIRPFMITKADDADAIIETLNQRPGRWPDRPPTNP